MGEFRRATVYTRNTRSLERGIKNKKTGRNQHGLGRAWLNEFAFLNAYFKLLPSFSNDISGAANSY
jgi:hypothetical protein